MRSAAFLLLLLLLLIDRTNIDLKWRHNSAGVAISSGSFIACYCVRINRFIPVQLLDHKQLYSLTLSQYRPVISSMDSKHGYQRIHVSLRLQFLWIFKATLPSWVQVGYFMICWLCNIKRIFTILLQTHISNASPCLLCGLDRIHVSLPCQINVTSFTLALPPFDFSTSGLNSPERVFPFSTLNIFSDRYTVTNLVSKEMQ